jgi:hypothetical protein
MGTQYSPNRCAIIPLFIPMQKPQNDLIDFLIAMRFAVGYLGEKGQVGWWQSSFFIPGVSSFLGPVFTKTLPMAQLTGVTAAAALVHDERIGVGQVYHLFRLPAALEQEIFAAARDLSGQGDTGRSINPLRPGSEKADALAYLQAHAATVPVNAVGPTRMGDRRSLDTAAAWASVAASYLHGFSTGAAIYPYFSDTTA